MRDGFSCLAGPTYFRARRGCVAVAISALALLPAACGPSDPGTRLFRRKCAGCHGPDGRGRTKYADGHPYVDLTDEKWKHGGDLESIRRLIANGDPKSPMPPYEGRLSPEEIDAVARYVQGLGRQMPPTLKP